MGTSGQNGRQLQAMDEKRGRTFTEGHEASIKSREPLSTRDRLKSCYLELLKQQGMEQIKVTDLCSLAGVGRGTFYSYYHRLDDLVDDLFEDIFEQIDPSCCKFLKYENVTYRGGIPPCEFIRSHRTYLPLFLDDTLQHLFHPSPEVCDHRHHLVCRFCHPGGGIQQTRGRRSSCKLGNPRKKNTNAVRNRHAQERPDDLERAPDGVL